MEDGKAPPIVDTKRAETPVFRPVSPLAISSKGIIPVTGHGKLNRKHRQKTHSAFNVRKIKTKIQKHLESRLGSVLHRGSLLKVDHYPTKVVDPSVHPSAIPVAISGAQNLRQSPSSRVYGVAQPSIHGVRGILNILRCGRAQNFTEDPNHVAKVWKKNKEPQEVLWINMREEPIVYINGRAIVLRDKDEPFRNLTGLRGISKERIEALEWRLKEDVVAEAERNGGNILLHLEVKKRELQPTWEAIRVDDVKTPEEVFFMFRMEGYRVRYYRLPTTPEESPSKKLFDLLLMCLMESSETTNIVFNCQTGQSRSTVGMVAARLVHMWRGPGTTLGGDSLRRSSIRIPPTQPVDLLGESKVTRVISGHSLSTVEAELKMRSAEGDSNSQTGSNLAHVDDTSKSLLAGWYQPVLKVIRLLEHGREAKAHVDHFIDECTHVVNLREVIFRYRKKASLRPNEPQLSGFQITRAGTALIRYILLIMFDSYLYHQVQKSLSDEKQSDWLFAEDFEMWVQKRPGLIRILNDIERSPNEALEAISFASLPFEVSSMVTQDQREVLEAIAARRGSMLNTDTILKLDHYPSAENAAIRSNRKEDIVEIHGAPNFRTIQNRRLSGVCTPTLESAFSILRYLEASYKSTKRVVWSNLREEPIVYINKRPFSLRSIRKPFRNVDTFTDITESQLEAAEVRLKEDILAEANQYNGKVLVHIETEEKELQSLWEEVAEDDVMTPKEVFEYIESAQLNVDYKRLPIYPERPPSAEDVDMLIRRVREFKDDANVHFLFNCQMGKARSTMAMIIAYLELSPTGSNTNQMSLRNAEEFASGSLERIEEIDDPLVHRDKEDQDDLDASSIDSSEGAEHQKAEPEYNVILSLVRVLRNGISAKRWADHVIDKCSAIENIRHSIEACATKAAHVRTVEHSNDYVQRALIFLRRYFVIVCIAAYEGDFYSGLTTDSYSEWFNKRPELSTLYKHIQSKEDVQAAALDSVLSAPPPDTAEFASNENDLIQGDENEDQSDEDVLEYVANRSGMVLIRGSILKSDHFPGCNRLKTADVKVEGAPNFRKAPYIARPGAAANGLDVFGTGIPTLQGVKGILDYLNKDGRGKTVSWINLREEPILYINGKPFVLRKLEHPFGNLEHTGISKERVESMEARLKLDVIQEVMENGNGSLLLHDEDDIGLTPVWQKVDVSEGSCDLMTPRDMYNYIRGLGYDVQDFRVPITDEQAPKTADYDKLMRLVNTFDTDASVVVNCQMGRGRTTTGMIVVYAVRLWQMNELKNVEYILSEATKQGHRFKSKLRDVENRASPEELTFLRGEFKSTLNLITVIIGGSTAKAIVDCVIDLCDSMQNIREAIYDLKLQCEKPDLSALRLAQSQGRGAHYTIRYCQLIQFVSYLLSEDPSSMQVKPIKKYAEWMKERPEVVNATRRLKFPP